MTTVRRFPRRFAAAVLALAWIALPDAAVAKDIFLAMAAKNDPTAETAAAMALTFKKQVEDASQGALHVEIFPDGQLGGNREMTKLVSRNVVQSAIVTVGGVEPLYPLIAVTQMPFAFTSREIAYAVLDGSFGQHMGDEIARTTGFAVLGYGDTGGFYVLTNSKREIHSPQDMEGIKVRSIPGFEVLNAMISGMGGIPVKVSSREEFRALGSGVVDGEMNPVSVVFSRRYDDVQKFMTLTNHLYAPYVWVMNKEFLDGLTEEEQAVVREAARQAVQAGRELSRYIETSDRGLPTVRKRMQVYEPTAEERQAFKLTAQAKVKESIAATLGAEGVETMDDFFAAIIAAEASLR